MKEQDMKIAEITGVKKIKPLSPDQAHIEGLKRQKDNAAKQLKAARERQKLQQAQSQLGKLSSA
jgi:hypothetical protein